MGIADSANFLDGGSNNELAVGDVDYFENLELPEDWLNLGFVEEWDSDCQIPFDDTFLQSTNNEVPEIKQLQNCVHEYTGSDSNKIEEVQETLCVFQPTSPVSELESSGSCSGAKSLPIKFNVCHPVRCRSKLVRSSCVDRWRAVAPDFASAAAARKMTSNSRRYKNRCKKMPHLSVARKSVKDSIYDTENPATIKKCTHCQITKTPQWREGPNGPKTLCNACGVRYRSGRLYPEYRPAASPTFVPSLHSNSHKKVIEMRNKVKPHLTINEEPEPPIMPPQPEFLPVSSYPVFEEVPIPLLVRTTLF